MEKEIENLDSTNEELNDINVDETDDIAALRESYTKLTEKNRQLFERAKKAELDLKDLKGKKSPEESKKEEKPKVPQKPSELDYSHLAFLSAKGIEEEDELDLVTEVMSETGKELREVVKTNYFQSRLKELRGIKTARAALPKSSTRFAPSSRDSLEYWVAKYDQTGELPPREQVELRRKVIKERLKSEDNKSKFADVPIIT